MKRMLICAGLVVALASFTARAPAGAAANRTDGAARVRSFHGTVDPDGTVEFKARIRHGEPVRVKGSPHRPGFTWEGVPIECETGSLPWDALSGYLPFSIKVEGRRFHGRGSNGHAIANVRGRFRKHGRRAGGTLRVHGDFPRMDALGCETGRGHWSARRVPA